MYSPKELVFEAPQKFSFKAETQELINQVIEKRCGGVHDHWNSNNDNYSNMLSQLYSIEQVCKLCEKSGEDYDFVVLSRFDNNITEFPLLNDDLDKGKFYVSNLHPIFPDMVYFFDQKFLPSQYFYSRVDRIIKKYQWELWEPSNEALKYFSTVDFLGNYRLEKGAGGSGSIKAFKESGTHHLPPSAPHGRELALSYFSFEQIRVYAVRDNEGTGSTD